MNPVIANSFLLTPLTFYLGLGAVLFSLGAIGVLIRKNVIVILMCIELMLNGVNLTFIALGRHFQDLDTHIFTVMIMAVAAAEASIGLAIVVSIFRNFLSTNVADANELRG